MSKISQIISQIVDVRIPEGEWTRYLPMLDRERKLVGLNTIKIIFSLCEVIEGQEVVNEELHGRIDNLGAIVAKLENMQDIKPLPKPDEKSKPTTKQAPIQSK